MSRMEPQFDLVLLERERPAKIGSILVPNSAQIRNAPSKGVVIAKGPNADTAIRVGATYVFGQHSGSWVNPDGKPAALTDEDARYFVCKDVDLIIKVSAA